METVLGKFNSKVGDKFKYNGYDAEVKKVYDITELTPRDEEEIGSTKSELIKIFPHSQKLYEFTYIAPSPPPYYTGSPIKNDEGINSFMILNPDYKGPRLPVHILKYIKIFE